MGKGKGDISVANSLLDPTRRNDPQVLTEYEKVNAEQRKVAKQAELAGLMNALKQVEAELRRTSSADRARVNFFKRKKREAESAIKNWQALNGFG